MLCQNFTTICRWKTEQISFPNVGISVKSAVNIQCNVNVPPDVPPLALENCPRFTGHRSGRASVHSSPYPYGLAMATCKKRWAGKLGGHSSGPTRFPITLTEFAVNNEVEIKGRKILQNHPFYFIAFPHTFNSICAPAQSPSKKEMEAGCVL